MATSTLWFNNIKITSKQKKAVAKQMALWVSTRLIKDSARNITLVKGRQTLWDAAEAGAALLPVPKVLICKVSKAS